MAHQQGTPSPMPREIPDTMWDRIAEVRGLAATDDSYNVREALLSIGQRFDFTESEMIVRGLIAAPRRPDPNALKGGRRQ
jgi:hypothetical protein